MTAAVAPAGRKERTDNKGRKLPQRELLFFLPGQLCKKLQERTQRLKNIRHNTVYRYRPPSRKNGLPADHAIQIYVQDKIPKESCGRGPCRQKERRRRGVPRPHRTMHGKKKWRKCVLFMMLALMAGAGASGTDIPVPGTAAAYAASAEGTGTGAADESAEKKAVSGSTGEQEGTPAADKTGKESTSGGQEAGLQEQAGKGGAGEDATDTAGTASAAGTADSGKDSSGRAEETEVQEPYIYDYAEVISGEFETEFNQKVSEAGGHLKVLVVDGFSRSKYQYENYYNDKNGIDKSVMVVYDIHSNANPHVYAGARGETSLNKIGYETLAWVQNCYSPGGGYITEGNAEANCRELLKAHLKICRKYKNVKQAETKPVKRKTFNK